MPSTPEHPRHLKRRGPYMLRLTGKYGFGRHSEIDIADVAILDLSVPPDDDPPQPPDGEASSRQFVPSIVEDEVPAPGLDVDLGGQVLVHDMLTNEWALVDND